MLDITRCTGRNRYTGKDIIKARHATKFIGRGSPRSSTDAYRRAIGPDLANCGTYSCTDIVFVSAEGARPGRLNPDSDELQLAIAARATFITDVPADRQRPYNVGERQVETLLTDAGYIERRPGIWSPAPG